MSKSISPRGVTCMAWSPDGAYVALSPNSSAVSIYRTGGSEDAATWEKAWELNEHDGFVSSLDWNERNELVSVSHDRNAYVWKLSEADNEWKPELVLLRINRAATFVKWSPNCLKFAVASGALMVPVCYYDIKEEATGPDNKWWVSKAIKKKRNKKTGEVFEPFDSTVLTLAWSRSSKFLVTGGTDNKVRIFSAAIKSVDKHAEAVDDGFADAFDGKPSKFGNLMAEFDTQGWVHSLAWSPAGTDLVASCHDSRVLAVDLTNGCATSTLAYTGLPFTSVVYLNPDTVIGVGWDCKPMVLTKSGAQWVVKESLDQENHAKAVKKTSNFDKVRGMFGDASERGISFGKAKADESLKTKHQDAITEVRLVPGSGKVCTISLDGHVYFWEA